MSTDDPLTEFRRRFRDSWPQRAEKLRRALEQYQATAAAPEAGAELRQQLHQLAGTAAVFGADAIMQPAKQLAQWLRERSVTASSGPPSDAETRQFVLQVQALIGLLEQGG